MVSGIVRMTVKGMRYLFFSLVMRMTMPGGCLRMLCRYFDQRKRTVGRTPGNGKKRKGNGQRYRHNNSHNRVDTMFQCGARSVPFAEISGGMFANTG